MTPPKRNNLNVSKKPSPISIKMMSCAFAEDFPHLPERISETFIRYNNHFQQCEETSLQVKVGNVINAFGERKGITHTIHIQILPHIYPYCFPLKFH